MSVSPFSSYGNCKNRIILFLFIDSNACRPIVINSTENKTLTKINHSDVDVIKVCSGLPLMTIIRKENPILTPIPHWSLPIIKHLSNWCLVLSGGPIRKWHINYITYMAFSNRTPTQYWFIRPSFLTTNGNIFARAMSIAWHCS